MESTIWGLLFSEPKGEQGSVFQDEVQTNRGARKLAEVSFATPMVDAIYFVSELLGGIDKRVPWHWAALIVLNLYLYGADG